MGAFAPSQFTADNAASYMNPYLTAALQPQIDEARRQSEIDRIANASYMQSLLQGLPTGTQSYQYSQPSTLNSITKSAGEGMNFVDLFKNII